MKASWTPVAPCSRFDRHEPHIHSDGRCTGDNDHRCDADAVRGTGTGVCDTRLDERGQCPQARNHRSQA